MAGMVMIPVCWIRIRSLAVLVGFLAVPGNLLADEQRLRTLKHDPSRSEWVEVAEPSPGTAEGDIHGARVLLKQGKYSRAITAAKKFVKKYGKSDAQYPDALLIEAEARVAKKQYTKAEKVLKTFFAEFSGMASTTEALRLKFVVAEAFLGGAKKIVWGIFPVSAEDDGLQMLDEISADFPNDTFAELAIRTKGDHLFRTGEFDIAELEYSRMLREYPRSRYHQYAMRRTAESALASFAGTEYDDAPLIEAQQRYEDYRRAYPADADQEGVGLILDTIYVSRAEKMFSIAAYYDRTNHVSSAIFYYEKVVSDFPETVSASKARTRLDLIGASRTSAARSTAAPSAS